MINQQLNIPLKLKQSVFFSSILVLIITNSGNVISLIFQVLLSRNLNLNDFSLFYSLVAFINIIVSPFTSFNLYIQKIAILEVDSLKKISVINITFIYFFIGVSAIFFFIFLIFINSIKNKFGHFDNYTYINFFLIFFFTLLNITPTSILISLKVSIHVIFQ